MPRLPYSEELCVGLLVAVLQLAAHQPAQGTAQALLLQVMAMSLRSSGKTPGPEQKSSLKTSAFSSEACLWVKPLSHKWSRDSTVCVRASSCPQRAPREGRGMGALPGCSGMPRTSEPVGSGDGQMDTAGAIPTAAHTHASSFVIAGCGQPFPCAAVGLERASEGTRCPGSAGVTRLLLPTEPWLHLLPAECVGTGCAVGSDRSDLHGRWAAGTCPGGADHAEPLAARPAPLHLCADTDKGSAAVCTEQKHSQLRLMILSSVLQTNL